MKPPKRDKMEFERIPKYDEWISGSIIDIEYDENHKRSFQGEDKTGPCVRFKLGLKGCNFPHRSKWITFSYGEKANLYKNFLLPLVEGAEPYMDLDLDVLKGMAIKSMWSEDGEYDKLVMIRPLGEKLKPGAAEPSKTTTARAAQQSDAEEEVPF